MIKKGLILYQFQIFAFDPNPSNMFNFKHGKAGH